MDITLLASAKRSVFYRLYLVLDIYSRKIVGWEVHERESAAHAAELVRKACLVKRETQTGLGATYRQRLADEGRHTAGDVAALGVVV